MPMRVFPSRPAMAPAALGLLVRSSMAVLGTAGQFDCSELYSGVKLTPPPSCYLNFVFLLLFWSHLKSIARKRRMWLVNRCRKQRILCVSRAFSTKRNCECLVIFLCWLSIIFQHSQHYLPAFSTSFTSILSIIYQHSRHHLPAFSASFTSILSIIYQHSQHYLPAFSASFTSILSIIYQHSQHYLPAFSALFTSILRIIYQHSQHH